MPSNSKGTRVMDNLIRLTYVSTLRPNVTDADINDLVAKAADFNKAHRITGVLAIEKDGVCQRATPQRCADSASADRQIRLRSLGHGEAQHGRYRRLCADELIGTFLMPLRHNPRILSSMLRADADEHEGEAETAMSDKVLPQQKAPKLIVVMAFDRDEQGELQPAFDAMEQQTEDRAIRIAKGLAGKHAGVIAWSREANPTIGEYGEPTTLFVAGEVPDME